MLWLILCKVYPRCQFKFIRVSRRVTVVLNVFDGAGRRHIGADTTAPVADKAGRRSQM